MVNPEQWQRTSTGVLFQLFDETLELGMVMGREGIFLTVIFPSPLLV